MNFIGVALSLFLSNLFIRFIINILPIRKKRLWHLVVITLYDVSSLGTYIGYFFKTSDISNILYSVGGIIGVLIAYIASLTIILDGVKIFKSRRLKEFERSVNLKDGKSLPKNIAGIIFISLFLLLIGYSIFLIINFDKKLLVTLIGVLVTSTLFLGLGIYLIISGKAIHKTISSNNLMLIISLPNKNIIYTKNINKNNTINDALGAINDVYYLDELGLLITPTTKYMVRGMKCNSIADEHLANIKMDLFDINIDSVIENYKKYSRKKIVVDNDFNILTINDIK